MLQCSRFQNVRSRLPPSSEHFSIYGLAARSQGDAARLSFDWVMKGGTGRGVSLAWRNVSGGLSGCKTPQRKG